MIIMDKFESYLFNKIINYQNRLEDNKGNSDIEWVLNSCIEEITEVFSVYNLEYKNQLEA